MPRGPHLDTPGVLQHVMARGTVPQATGPLQLLRHYRQFPEPNPVLASGAADMAHLADSYSQPGRFSPEEPHFWL